MTDTHPNARAAMSRGRPSLSVLTPLAREDRPDRAAGLIAGLRDEIGRRSLQGRVEVLVLLDGVRARSVETALADLGGAGRRIDAERPLGRGAARNALAAAARGAWFLYVEPNASPSDDLLARWLDIVAAHRPWIALGGARCAAAADSAEALVHALAPHDGAGPHTCLLAHCDILARERFDETFHRPGWGDLDWVVRARRHAPLHMVEMPGLFAEPRDEDALERCRAEAIEFAHLVRRHPDLQRFAPTSRFAQAIAGAPAIARLRPLLAHAVRRSGPRGIRSLAAELWRASWYAEALR